ncbi:GNAT family N-acetyltransferase [Halolamina rubra]|uniref:GNAT family N-acetyltransferase n=1 Tax=Halolamina rubra TaxID=1380430 RepID=UPI001F162BFE|nr:GNAT family protein [Halolamina rubra]
MSASLFPDAIETDRLQFSRVGAEGVDAGPLDLYEHWGERAPDIEATTEHVSWDPHPHPASVAETLDRGVERAEDGGGAMFLIRPREGEPKAGEIAGTTGLFLDWDRRIAVFGMWLRKPFWGRGYSGERADAMFELAFRRLDLDAVRVSHVPENGNSERAITKYVERHGGRREGLFRNRIAFEDGSVHDTVEYSLGQSEWRDADAAGTAVQLRD